MAKALANLRESYAPERLDAEIDKLIAMVDNIVGPALGLTLYAPIWPMIPSPVCARDIHSSAHASTAGARTWSDVIVMLPS